MCPNHKTPTRPSLNIRVYSDVKPWNFGVHSDIKILHLRFSCKLRSSSENLLPMHDWKVYSSKFTHFTTTGNWTAPNASGEGELESLYISIIYIPFNLLWDGIIILLVYWRRQYQNSVINLCVYNKILWCVYLF